MNLVLLCYWFPPIQNAASLRPLTWIRHLARRGWNITVVTTESDPYSGRYDPSLLRLIPENVRVERIPAVFFTSGFPDHLTLASSRIGSLADRILDETGPAVLVSTSLPYSLHIEAGLLAMRRGMPWLADFRDLWVRNPVLAPKGLFGLAARFLEQAILKQAGAVTVVGEAMRETLASAAPGARIEVIRNAADPADLPAHHPPADKLRVVWTGYFYGPRKPEPFLEAFSACAAASPIPLEFVLAGPKHPAFSHLPANVQYAGELNWQEAMELLASANLALIENPSPGDRTWISRKIYEALAIGVPVVAGTEPESELAMIVREANAGWIVPATSEGYSSALRDAAAKIPNLPRPNRDRFPLAGEIDRLARLLEEIAS